MKDSWPRIPYSEWRETCTALHLWSQIVGKYRLAHAPWVNHSWHATFYVTSRGLTTGPVGDGARSMTLSFDFSDHVLLVETDGCARAVVPLEPAGRGIAHDPEKWIQVFGKDHARTKR